MALLLVFVGWLHLTTLLLTALLGYFFLNRVTPGRHKIIGMALYVLVILSIAFGLYFFSKRAYVELPKIVDSTIPALVEFAEKQNFELPFTDYASFKTVALQEARESILNVGRFTRQAGLQAAMVLIGLVVAASIFLNAGFILENDPHASKGGVYSEVGRQLARRFELLYQSFAVVMGAQIVISAINTMFTSLFIFGVGFPHAVVILVLTFLCGLLPIVGNILSNSLIVGVGFTLSPKMALLALLFLVVIHKLEYFLNSKIVGQRIKNPMWLTLIGLIVGERLMGIPGMVLAPVLLHYFKVESSSHKLAEQTGAPRS